MRTLNSFLLVGMVTVAVVFSSAQASARPKNFVIILTDDQGWGDLSCYGSETIETPHLDRMAAEGLRTTSCYVASSVCSPSRAALLTGRMPKRVGVPNVLFPNSTTGLPPEEITIAEMLKEQGYATAVIGKWHLGHQAQYMPMNQGFDSFFGLPYSNDMSIAKEFDISPDIQFNEGYTMEKLEEDRVRYLTHYRDLKDIMPLMRDNTVIEYPVDQKTLIRLYTEEAINFIEENREQPFFLYLPHTMPHKPHFVEEAFEGSSGAGIFGDIVQHIDWSVGEVLSAIKDNGIAGETLVFFCSDNGPIPEGSAGPMKGNKFSTFEGGMRTPGIFWAPGTVLPGMVSDEIISTLDLFPTIAHYAGVNVPEDRTYDGYNLSDLLEGNTAESPREEIFYYGANTELINGIRVGDWKYQLWGEHPRQRKQDQPPKLYNVSKDIGETNNVIDQYPEIAEKLRKRMEAFDASVTEW
ncbi:MAG: sulfatase [Verrucomicrobiota bacterium]